MSNPRRGFVYLSLLLILISVAVHTHHIDSAGLTTADDIRAELKTREILRDGWKAYWQDVANVAAGEGRFYYYGSLGVFFLPYVFPDGLLRAAVIFAVQFASLVALALYLRRYLSSLTFWFLLALLCAMLPLWNNFHPVTALPVFYHVPVLLFFSALMLRARTMKSRPLARWSYLAPLFASLWFYEALVLPFLVIATVDALSPGLRARRLIGTVAPVLLVFALWAGLFAGYRQLHIGTYTGSALAPFSLTATLRGIAAFSGKGIPGMNLLLQAVLIPEVARGYLPILGIPAILLAHLSAIGWAQALLALALGVLYCWSGGSERKPAQPGTLGTGWLRTASPVLLCIFIAFLLPLPLTITAKYRDTAAVWAPYVPGYYAFLAWMTGFAFTIEPLVRVSRRLRLARFGAAAILGAGCFVLVGGTAIANDAVGAAQARLALKWKVVDALLKTSALDRLAPGSVVFAPALWEGLAHVDWVPYEDYWTQYIALHSGRRLAVARTADGAGLLNDPVTAAYYATPVAGGCSGDGLLLTGIVRDAGVSAQLVSNEFILVSKNAPYDCDLQAIRLQATGADKPGDLLTDGDPHTYLRLPRAAFQNGVYVDAFKTPVILAASATLAPNSIEHWRGVPTVAMEFVKGFSTREWSGDKFWVWSNGSSGEGELNFRNNTGHALAARFHSTIITGDPAKARLDVEGVDWRASEMVANGETCDWVFRLQPGDNRVRIKSFAQRKEAPDDARYIVFGLRNWSLVRYDEPSNSKYRATASMPR